jgi:hypothetical protein
MSDQPQRDLTPQGLPVGWSEVDAFKPSPTGDGSSGLLVRIGAYFWLLVVAVPVGIVLIVVIAVLGSARGWFGAAAPQAARPDSATAVVRQYVQAALNDRDGARARAVVCRSPQLAEIDELLDDLTARERQFKVRFSVEVAAALETTNRDAATVAATLVIEAGEPAERSTRRYEFTVVRESGWRVCGVHLTA